MINNFLFDTRRKVITIQKKKSYGKNNLIYLYLLDSIYL